MIPKSNVAGVVWPALPNDVGSLILALQHQFVESEALPADELEKRQLLVLRGLLAHAARTVPYYRDGVAYSSASAPLTSEAWRQLPVLARAEVQEAGAELWSEAVPAQHLPLGEVVTSGSTGRPVRVAATRVTRIFWHAITVRDQLWHRRDVSRTLAAIRTERSGSVPAGGVTLDSWGPGIGAAYQTGPCLLLSVQHDVDSQAKALEQYDPEYLLSLPTNLLALTEQFRSTGARLPRLREVCSYGEVVGPKVRAACREVWGVDLIDAYSTQELGYIALQCPRSEQYHVQAESVYVEVLDEAGLPCGPGQVGRVVVTPLHNWATPLLRYEVGDYAEVGAGCPCGRRLPVLRRVMGRRRNMMTLPDGRRVWPQFGVDSWAHIDAIRQFQLVQTELDHIEARIVGPRPLTDDEASEVTRALRERLGAPIRVSFTYLDHIDRSRSLKFEDFVCLI